MSGRPSIRLIGSRLRRARARRAIAIASVGLGLIGFTAFTEPSPWLVWNRSASAPIGLYFVGFDAPAHGDLVLVRVPESVAELAGRRGYLPRSVPLVKRIAAQPGEHVCAFNEVIIIGGDIVARRLETDRQGRPLPWWDACRRLSQNEVFLLNGDALGSFDSRYFGPVPIENVIGRLVPLWTG
ncbi:S26 family signal peptidase [Chelativorans sp. M5D2P16]|uniref:S26 family signal peptidase n=1 Tax=Chelativorans sp. M5D2P16 TaxID=3095678 RepID=UPI002ACAE40A|nr:S26 family signal peptidase [Chelativorans sp. M5D2P16]MDZ5698683.1 S26 family signal peptidase [Chelativorans sp. M5D2P16]